MGSSGGIPVDKAQLLSSLLEALLYGFSLLMFGGTIGVLCVQRSFGPINRRMLAVACLLLLFSTAHFVINVIRIMEGFILFRNTYPGGPVAFFENPSQWAFVYKNYIYTAQTLLGDGVIIYRCYAVWRSKLVMVIPVLLWCSILVTGVGTLHTASYGGQAAVFDGSLAQWITSFYTTALATNLLTTILLVYRIWSVDRTTTKHAGCERSQLRHILHVIIDAGAIYSVTLLAALLCFVNGSNGQYVILDMVTPAISITFYMVIIRVRLAGRETGTMASTPLKWMSSSNDTGLSTNIRSGMQVRVVTLTERKSDNYPPLSVTPKDAPVDRNAKHQSEIRFDTTGEAV